MQTKFIEVTNNDRNWGKFLVGKFTEEEWKRKSFMVTPFDGRVFASLLTVVGWTPSHIMVLDLQTGEGAIFRPGGYAKADLNKHKIWVCPMYEPFLEWLYKQDLEPLENLPDKIDLPDAPFAMSGYRREGTEE